MTEEFEYNDLKKEDLNEFDNFCEECKTKDLNRKINELVEKLVVSSL